MAATSAAMTLGLSRRSRTNSQRYKSRQYIAGKTNSCYTSSIGKTNYFGLPGVEAKGEGECGVTFEAQCDTGGEFH
jgi:hypothetical protein